MRCSSPCRSARIYALLGLLVTLATVTVVFVPTLGVGFDYMIDDWELLEAAGTLHPQVVDAEYQISAPGLWETIRMDARRNGRLRPGYWLIRDVLKATLGADPTLWHRLALTVLLMTVVSLFAFAYFGTRSALIATYTAVVFTFLPGVADNYISVSHAETWAVGFLALGVALVAGSLHLSRESAGRTTILGLAFSLLYFAALCKESALLAIPAAILFGFLTSREPAREFRSHTRELAWAGVVFVALLVAFVTISRALGPTYAGTFVTDPIDRGRLRSAWIILDRYLLSYSALWPFILAGITVAALPRLRSEAGRLGAVTAVTLIGVVPQILLYSARDYPSRYYFAVLAAVLVLGQALALGILRASRRAFIVGLIALAMLPTLYWQGRGTAQDVAMARARACAYQEMVDELAAAVPDGYVVVIPDEVGGVFEAGRYLLGELAQRGRSDISVRWAPLEGVQRTTVPTFTRSTLDLDRDRVGAIAVPSRKAEAMRAAEALSVEHSLEARGASCSYRVWSWKRLSWSQRDVTFEFWITGA